MADGIGPLPTPPLNPALIQLMQGGTQQSSTSPLGPTSPVQGLSDPNMQGLAELSQQQIGQLLGTPIAQEEAARRGQITQLGQQASQLAANYPQTSWAQSPYMRMQPVTGQGIGHDIGNALADMGRGVALGFGATTPGRAIQGEVYGPSIAQYKAKQQALAEQIAALGGTETSAQQELGTLGGVAGRAVYAGGKLTGEEVLSDVQKQRIQVMAEGIQKDYEAKMASIANENDMNQKRVDAEILAAHIRAAVDAQVAGIGAASRQQVEAVQSQTLQAIANLKGTQDPTVWGAIQRAFGEEIPQLQAAPTPAASPVPSTPAKPASSAAKALPAGAVPGTLNGKRGYVLDGKFHAE